MDFGGVFFDLDLFHGKTLLTPGFKDDHRHCIGQVQAAIAGTHRQGQTELSGNQVPHSARQAAGFRTEDQGIVAGIADRVVAHGTTGTECKQPLRLDGRQRGSKIIMHLDARGFVIVKPGAAELAVIQGESKRAYQVQMRAGIGAQADDIAGIGRDFGLVQDDIKHGVGYKTAVGAG